MLKTVMTREGKEQPIRKRSVAFTLVDNLAKNISLSVRQNFEIHRLLV